MAVTEGTLPRMDAPPLDYSDFSPEMKRWMSDLIDAYNQAMVQIESLLP